MLSGKLEDFLSWLKAVVADVGLESEQHGWEAEVGTLKMGEMAGREVC